jgi:hypothetical protein
MMTLRQKANDLCGANTQAVLAGGAHNRGGLSNMAPPSIRAAIYARKSTLQTGDEDSKSTVRQVENAKAFIAAKGWTLREDHIHVDEAVSGAASLRSLKAKARMLDAVHTTPRPFDVLVLQSQDRLSRRDGYLALGELVAIARAGVEIWWYADRAKFEHGDFEKNLLAFFKTDAVALPTGARLWRPHAVRV